MEMVVTRTTRLIVLYDKDFRQRHPPAASRGRLRQLVESMKVLGVFVGHGFSRANYEKFFKPHKNHIFRHRNKKTIKLCYEETKISSRCKY